MSDLLDGLYTPSACSDEFIKDISKRMQVPHRISFGPADGLDHRMLFGPADLPNMRVPERIMVVDNDEPVGVGNEAGSMDHPSSPDGHSSYELNADEFDVRSIAARPSLEPPPATLVLNEVSYPDVERLREECIQPLMHRTSSQHSPESKHLDDRCTKDMCEDPLVLTRYLSPTQMNNSAHATDTVSNLKRLRLLERRMTQLEREHLARQQWDKLGLMITGAYFAYRVLQWIVTHL